MYNLPDCHLNMEIYCTALQHSLQRRIMALYVIIWHAELCIAALQRYHQPGKVGLHIGLQIYTSWAHCPVQFRAYNLERTVSATEA